MLAQDAHWREGPVIAEKCMKGAGSPAVQAQVCALQALWVGAEVVVLGGQSAGTRGDPVTTGKGRVLAVCTAGCGS